MIGPDPSEVARRFHQEIRAEVEALKERVKLVGVLTHDSGPSKTYSEYTRKGCEAVGVEFELRQVNKLDVEAAITAASAEKGVHGILIYYPIFGTGQDSYLKDVVDHRKDVEGFSTTWVRKLYSNDRFADESKTAKAVLPCTPLAVLKMLSAAGAIDESKSAPAAGKTITVFNRSEVVGRPLATMLSNDGARVYSFDIDGVIEFENGKTKESKVSRAEALASSDIVITGVPSKEFPVVRGDEIRAEAVCLNFSTVRNFAPDAEEKARIFIPRVGPVTVAMCLRNTVRLYKAFHQS